MKTERSINPDLDLDSGGHVQQHLQPPTDEAVPLGKIDIEHDAVYFGADSSPRAFSGRLSEGLGDDEIIEYIRRSNRPLHDRLWGTTKCQPIQTVTLAATEQLEFSDGAGDTSPTDDVNRLEVPTEATFDASTKPSTCRSTSIALPLSPDSVSNFGSCARDALSTPSSSVSVLQPALSVPRSKKELQRDLHLLQKRRYIQSLLLNDHILVLQKVPPAEAKVRSRSCDHPLCEHTHGIPPGTYRLSLESRKALEKSTATTEKYSSPKVEDSGRYLKVRSTNSRGFYCLTCLEGLFGGIGMLDNDYATSASIRRASQVPDIMPSTPMSLDGSSDENLALRTIVLQAAEKLHPATRPPAGIHVRPQTILETKFANTSVLNRSKNNAMVDPKKDARHSPLTMNSTNGDLAGRVALEFPSNSDEALFLREAKRQDTELTLRLLRHASYNQEAGQHLQSSSNWELPTLRISRPTDLPPREERYKKQGLGRHNLQAYRSSLSASHLHEDNAVSTTADINGTDSGRSVAPVKISCPCHEPNGVEEMIKCSAEFCLVGWVHLKCSGLPRHPIKDETWFCKECSTLFGPGTFDPGLILTPKADVNRTRVLRSSVRDVSNLIDSVDSENEASDELSTEDTSLPLSDDEMRDPTYILPVTPRRQSKSYVSMASTPYEFLDGAGDGKPAFSSPPTSEDTTMVNTAVPISPTPTKEEPKTAKVSLMRIKRPSTLSLQDPDEPRTPTKRLKRTPSSPPPPLTPPSRHIKTSFGHLGAFIYPETRTSAAALSNPQIVALEKWKSIHLYSPLAETIESFRSETAGAPKSKKKNRQPSARPSADVNVATMESGGAVIDLPAIHGQKLSEILSKVDSQVEEELRKQGATGWEQGVPAREEAVKIGKAKSSGIDEQNGITSPKVANEVRRRISRSFSVNKE